MIGALQCEFIRDSVPVLLIRNRIPIYFFPFFPILPGHTPGESPVLGTALDTRAPLAGVLLYQCADSDVSVLQQSVHVLSVSSTQQSWQWLKKPESMLVLRMVFRRLRVLWECSVNHECTVAGSGRQLNFLAYMCSRIAWIMGTEGRNAENSGVLQPLLT